MIQAIFKSKFAQNMTSMKIINKARLAMHFLQSGETTPAFYSKSVAQKNIKSGINSLQQDVQNILMFFKARQTLMSNLLSTLVDGENTEKIKNIAISIPAINTPVINHGAIAKKNLMH